MSRMSRSPTSSPSGSIRATDIPLRSATMAGGTSSSALLGESINPNPARKNLLLSENQLSKVKLLQFVGKKALFFY